tara:strand:+ start:38153 stop:38320 length:168 start_codon:yes stop_codon:yes gene_type:complete
VVAGDEKPAPVEPRGETDRLLDRSECDIAEVQDNVVGRDGVVPSADQRGVHLFDR